ncbi:UNVERIFIED_CONTAM: hypothetical protein GTU68_002995, partial [Idotea baltica]|nr:hypothetical protein [Idotea baltica]
PGVGKTSLAKALAASVEGSFGRVQFTPDLLPADVVGTSVWNAQTSSFEFRAGPIFTNVLLADEVNRASPKTQSALLEAMAEQQVTADGVTRRLHQHFMVIATQNPLEHHGTYPLPESQLDRFMMKLSLGYPDAAHEAEILETGGERNTLGALRPVITLSDLTQMQQFAEHIHVSPLLREYLIGIAGATRSHPHLALGMSPRALLSLQSVSRVHAAAAGRDHVRPEDVQAIIHKTVGHRLLREPEARVHGISVMEILDEVIAAVPIPSTTATR